LTENDRRQDFKNGALNAYETYIGRKLLIRENAETEFAKKLLEDTQKVFETIGKTM
jgi:hypothetical protein